MSATSVEHIAAAAGCTRGAFYSNFNSKDDLFIELLRRDQRRIAAELSSLCSDIPSLDQIHLFMRNAYGEMSHDTTSFMNWPEARRVAARDTKFRAQFNTLLAEKRGQIAAFLGCCCRRTGVAPPMTPELMAISLMSLVEGVYLSMLASPGAVTADTAKSVLTLFVDAIMELAPAGHPARSGIELSGAAAIALRRGNLPEEDENHPSGATPV